MYCLMICVIALSYAHSEIDSSELKTTNNQPALSAHNPSFAPRVHIICDAVIFHDKKFLWFVVAIMNQFFTIDG